MFFRSKSLVGVDIGSSGVKVVELQPAGAGYRLTGFGYAPLPSEAIVQGSFMNASVVSDAVRSACGEAGIKSKSIASSVAGHSVIVKRIAIPIQSSEELERTIHWEAEQYIPFDINEVHIDYQVLRADAVAGQMEILLVAAKRDLIDDYISVFTDAGLTLAVMDVDAFAAGNTYEHCYAPGEDSVVAILDVGASVIKMNVVRGVVPVFTRDITSGGNQYTEEIQKLIGITFDEAERIKVGGRPGEVSRDVIPQEVEEALREVSDGILGEVQRSLEFYRATTGGGLDRVMLCGGGARVPSLDRMLQERLGVPVEVMDPFSKIAIGTGVNSEERVREFGPALCVAIGLGMRRMKE